MDSKIYIRAFALFMFDRGKAPKKPRGYIQTMSWLSGLSNGDFQNSEKATVISRPSGEMDAIKSSMVNLWSWFGREKPGIEFRCCQQTIMNALHDIGKVCKPGRWISFKLTDNHMIQRIVIFQTLLSMAKKKNCFDSI